MFLINKDDGCLQVGQEGCGDLLYFDSDLKSYSVVITTSVYIMASGDDSLPMASSSENSSAFSGWKIAVIVITVSFTILAIAAFAIFMFRRIF
mmetsp:Transcript_8199/g.11292  ORF Transcript_8199/g.11292 Transcript_8199/m.11292 type:complete len:93 (+) Transcript_8199:1978-2256(+)